MMVLVYFILIRWLREERNYNDFNTMIYQIYNLVSIAIKKNIIIFNLRKFLGLDIEIQTKLIEINYKFFYPKKRYLRYKKILEIVKNVHKQSKKTYNLASMNIEIKEDSIIFKN